MLTLVGERIIEQIATLETQPASDPDPSAPVTPPAPLPEVPTELEALLAELFERRIPRSINSAGPGHLSYIPNGGLFHGALAELITAVANRLVTYWGAAPELAQLEADVIRWFVRMIGLPEESFGVLTSGGSMANLSSVVAARQAMLGDDFSKGIIYTSEQAHHSIRKAAAIAGIPLSQVRAVPTDEMLCMRTDALVELIAGDRASGLRPFMIAATAGTTNTGAVDDLETLADFCAAEKLWLHADAAYGGFFAITRRGRRALAGIDRADSVVLDPHKGLFVPFGTGCLLVRDVSALRAAHAHRADCVAASVRTAGVNFADLSPELSRQLRGLRIWLPLRMLGIGAFEAALDEKLDLAAHAADVVGSWSDVELVTSPVLSTFAFRIRADDAYSTDQRTMAVLDAVNARRRVHLSSATIDGRPVIRVCVLSMRTHRRHVEAFIEDLRAAIDCCRP